MELDKIRELVLIVAGLATTSKVLYDIKENEKAKRVKAKKKHKKKRPGKRR